MKALLSTLDYWWALMLANMRFYKSEGKKLAIMSFSMMVQNTLFFMIWGVLFGTMDDLKGWHFQDMARMYGIIATAIGSVLFFFNGVRTLATRVTDGSLDIFITRPRPVLPALLMSSSGTSSLGDMFYGPLIWLTLGNVTAHDFLMLCLLTILVSIIFLSMSLIIYSLCFWLKGESRFSEQMFMVLIITSTTIFHGQTFWVRLALMTIIPTFFMNYLPVKLVHTFDWSTFGLLCASVVFYAIAAILVFNAGLRRYVRSVT